jgi:hypothetical protein
MDTLLEQLELEERNEEQIDIENESSMQDYLTAHGQ